MRVSADAKGADTVDHVLIKGEATMSLQIKHEVVIPTYESGQLPLPMFEDQYG